MTANKIKVLLVDDSPLVLTLLSRMINADKRMTVMATATSGQEALSIINREMPDVVCTDVHMPRMGGIELIKAIMAVKPLPILVVSVSVQAHQAENIFRLLESGAVDVFPKPKAGLRLNAVDARAFCDRVYVVSKVHVFKSGRTTNALTMSTEAPKFVQPERFDVVLMGGSTGAPQIYHAVFAQLKSNFKVPIVAVQHISDGFTSSLVEWLDRSTLNTVKIAEQGEVLKSSTIYFPPDGAHIEIRNHQVHLDFDGPLNCGSRPSVNVLFEASARAGTAKRTLAILLSGMGRDGADGMASLHRQGAYTIAQAEQSCAIFGMPKEALALKAVDKILAPSGIVELLNKLC